MSREMYDTLQSARKELREWAEENPDDDEPNERISEIADSSTPVYYSDILQWAVEDTDLATSEPELGPAFDGTATPCNIIAANIYEKISEECWEEWRVIQEERDEAELEENTEDLDEDKEGLNEN